MIEVGERRDKERILHISDNFHLMFTTETQSYRVFSFFSQCSPRLCEFVLFPLQIWLWIISTNPISIQTQLPSSEAPFVQKFPKQVI